METCYYITAICRNLTAICQCRNSDRKVLPSSANQVLPFSASAVTAISCKYSTFLRSTVFELTFLFLFKLRGELFYFKKPWLSIPEVKVKHLSKSCLFLILLYKSLGKENLTN